MRCSHCAAWVYASPTHKSRRRFGRTTHHNGTVVTSIGYLCCGGSRESAAHKFPPHCCRRNLCFFIGLFTLRHLLDNVETRSPKSLNFHKVIARNFYVTVSKTLLSAFRRLSLSLAPRTRFVFFVGCVAFSCKIPTAHACICVWKK